MGGAKVNSTHIGTFLQTYFVVGDSHSNVKLYTFESEEEIAVTQLFYSDLCQSE